MKQTFCISILGLLLCFLSCTTKKKVGEVGTIGKIYHNTTARYNGYYNADVILKESTLILEEQSQDNYNKLLPVYPAVAANNPKAVASELDRAIEKVTVAGSLHEPSHWVDDCYVLMGKAQFLKQDFESAEETFEYFAEEYDPANPLSRVYNRKDLKEKNEEIRKKQQEEERKQEQEKREREKDERAQARKDAEKKRKAELEQARKQREEESKQKERERKEREKASKKKSRRSGRSGAKERSKDAPKPVVEKEVKKEPVKNTKVETPKPVVKKPELSEDEKYLLAKQQEKQNKTATGKQSMAVNKGMNKGGLFKHKPVYDEGVFWLAKTYIERANWSGADYLLRKLSEDVTVSSDIAKELPTAMAHLSIKQKKYDEAITYLDRAIDVSSKKERARLAYIKAQLHQYHGSSADAYASFDEVLGYRPPYEMEFNAKLAMAKSAWSSDKESVKSILKKLDRMIKDRKNEEYLDQVYFTKAEIKMATGDFEGAKEDFSKALEEGKGNPQQRAESYYSLAQLFYNTGDYIQAFTYYDSTTQVLSQKDERFLDVRRTKDNLREISRNLKVLNKQDSLIAIANLPQDELNAWVKAEAEKRKKEREADLNLAEQAAAGPTTSPFQQNGAKVVGGPKSNYFAYNPALVLKGRQDFEKKWGERSLENDWRRSGKRSSVIANEETDQPDLEVEELDTDEEIMNILRDIPTTDKQKEVSLERIENALFDLGSLFRSKVQEYDASSTYLNRYITEYPGGEKELDVLYFLYLNAKDQNDNAKANQYLAMLQDRHPDAEYTRILTDPAYAEQALKESKKIDNYYAETYDLFSAGNYAQAKQRIVSANEQFGTDHALIAKFDLLSAMCVGSTEGKDAYVQQLDMVIKKYPNTPEQTRAREIMRFLKGDAEAFDGRILDEESEEFTVEDDKLHYVILVLYAANEKMMKDAKIAVSRYNANFHKKEKLKITNIYLNAENDAQLILVRKFKDKKGAMGYLETSDKNDHEFLDEEKFSFEKFAVTQRNYREIMKMQSVTNYRAFHEKNYK